MPLALAPLAACTLVAIPATAGARTPRAGIGVSGGNGAPPSTTTTPTTTSQSTGTGAAVIRLSGVVNASGNGITLTAAAAGTQGRPLTITGKAPTTDAGALIDIETAKATGSTWAEVATAVIAGNGSFSATWIPATSAQFAIRAVLAPGISAPTGTTTDGGGGLPGPASAATASTVVATSALMIPIFKNAVATLYGPGFWGHHTACGEKLTRSTLGVASRTLKCGSKVAVYYKGREITVPVIDRGPFSNHASWDLTMATAKALGVNQTSTIGTLAPAPAALIAAHS